jgi:hypothetical protein
VSTLGLAELQEKRHALRRRIESWRDIQQIYMPCIEQVRAAHSANHPHLSDVSSTSTSDVPSSTFENPETTPLFLPSSVPLFWSTGCVAGLLDKERRLRLAQADDGLNELRRQLRISATLLEYKKIQVGGSSQKMNTRMRSLMSRFHDKTIRCAERYSAAYKALSILDSDGAWTARLKPLDHKKDLRSPRRDDDDGSHETRRELSWIWLVSPVAGRPSVVASASEINDSKFRWFLFIIRFLFAESSPGLQQLLCFVWRNADCIMTAMRVEWAKTKARADRWREEVLLVTEEMRRTICFLEWKAVWWSELTSSRPDAPLHVRRGIAAYAAKQMSVCRSLAMSFAKQWYPILKKQGIAVEWPPQYIPAEPSTMDNS